MTYQEFTQTFHIRLNPQQEAAVRQTEGPVLLLAVPGSGKTTVLVTRLGYLLYCKGVAPEQILTVTYTRAATRDMAQRFAARFSQADADRLEFRTINGLCAKIIAYYARVKGARPFAVAGQDSPLNALVRELLVRSGGPYPSDQQIKDARTQITFCKNMLLSSQEIRAVRLPGMDFPALFDAYQSALRQRRLMDYDDQMVFAYRILRRYPDILAAVQRRYHYFCVDEAQDTSKIQHAILDLLARKSGNLFMVGDEDQSIYGFRAAWPQALLAFEETHPGAQVLLMETNYRSTSDIVARADAFIRRNQGRRDKHMRAENPSGGAVRQIVLSDYSRQAAYLRRAAEDPEVPTAILFRNNDSALPLLDLLERDGIPYCCRQREGLFFSSPLVRDLTDMLRFSFSMEDADAFLRFYYKLDLKLKKALAARALQDRRAGETVFETLLACSGLEGWQRGRVKAMQTHFSKLPKLPSYAALNRLLGPMGYADYLQDHHTDTARLDVLLALASQNPQPAAFLQRLEELRACMEQGADPQGACLLTLSTIHASKGLEYERVILIDAAQGIFPGSTPEGAPPAEALAALEEERRLFYVGVTRARSRLELVTYEHRFGGDPPAFPFVAQLLGQGERPQGRARRQARRSAQAPTAAQAAIWAKDYLPGAPVVHQRFGPGQVEEREGEYVRIRFPSGACKKFHLIQCLKKGLIALEGSGRDASSP